MSVGPLELGLIGRADTVYKSFALRLSAAAAGTVPAARLYSRLSGQLHKAETRSTELLQYIRHRRNENLFRAGLRPQID